MGFVFQHAAVRLDDELTEAEPDAAAPRFGAVAEVEYRSHSFRRNARAIVGETQNKLLAIALTGDLDGAAVRLGFDGIAQQVVEEVRDFFDDKVFQTLIPRTVRLSEAPSFGQPVTVYDSNGKGAEAYRKLAKEVVSRG